jgi:hypothetical protein
MKWHADWPGLRRQVRWRPEWKAGSPEDSWPAASDASASRTRARRRCECLAVKIKIWSNSATNRTWIFAILNSCSRFLWSCLLFSRIRKDKKVIFFLHLLSIRVGRYSNCCRIGLRITYNQKLFTKPFWGSIAYFNEDFPLGLEHVKYCL